MTKKKEKDEDKNNYEKIVDEDDHKMLRTAAKFGFVVLCGIFLFAVCAWNLDAYTDHTSVQYCEIAESSGMEHFIDDYAHPITPTSTHTCYVKFRDQWMTSGQWTVLRNDLIMYDVRLNGGDVEYFNMEMIQ